MKCLTASESTALVCTLLWAARAAFTYRRGMRTLSGMPLSLIPSSKSAPTTVPRLVIDGLKVTRLAPIFELWGCPSPLPCVDACWRSTVLRRSAAAAVVHDMCDSVGVPMPGRAD